MSTHNHRCSIERQLGDPSNPSAFLSFAKAVQNDELERFPEDEIQRLLALGLGPIADTGQWQFETLLETTTALSSRDLTVSIALGVSLLGALPVLLAGRRDQIDGLIQSARLGKHNCLALTEKSHGSDLAATEVTARLDGDDYVLTGAKWLIGNGTQASNISVLVRVIGEARPATAVLLFERSSVAAGAITPHAKIRTHGIRGADVSGFAFDNCRVRKSATVGKVGAGFELIGKALQISRILCCGFSLGAAETALKTTYAFARTRALYGRGMLEMHVARSELETAFVQALINEAVARVAHRCVHTHPDALALISAVSKAFVPQNADDLIRRCARLLGARHYLREEHVSGIFQKLKRDHEVVGLFDGSTAINQSIIASHLPTLAFGRKHGAGTGHAGEVDQARRLAFDLGAMLPKMDFPAARQLMLSSDYDPCVTPVSLARRELQAQVDTGARPTIALRFQSLLDGIVNLDEKVLAARRDSAFDPKSAPMFEFANEYLRLFAAMACVRVWAGAAPDSGLLLGCPQWLQAALAFLQGDSTGDDGEAREFLLSHFERLATQNLPLSLLSPV